MNRNLIANVATKRRRKRKFHVMIWALDGNDQIRQSHRIGPNLPHHMYTDGAVLYTCSAYSIAHEVYKYPVCICANLERRHTHTHIT